MTTDGFYPHASVLLEETLSCFEERSLSVFVDGTLGAGGHAEAVLRAHPEIQAFIGIDQDPLALEIASARLSPWKEKTHFYRGNFSTLSSCLRSLNVKKVDGMLLDLGVSSMQLDRAEKGFSFMREGPLDMRMNPEGELTAEEIVNEWPERELGVIFRDYGEEKQWRAAARAIVSARAKKRISSTIELGEVLQFLRFGKQKKKIHPLTLVFQALRIAVNRELDVLKQALPQAIEALKPGGVLAIISFHSLEDRLVKESFRFAASDKWSSSGIGGVFLDKKPEARLLTRKPLIASEEEMTSNPRSRSAKLRAIEKL